MVANNAEFLANEYEYGREVRLSGTGKNRTKTEMHEVKQPSLGGHTRKLVNNWTANDRRHRVHAKDN
ncbi:unnamed protein product [Bursaphelenchus xylophilus]|uniref:(pine wood nematode) hypothetical protein n=1 Tax=Bursaphelenchus xylophilus TaxID=6326 RepID=A0A1I7S558_BURXY|nr:unnamed protein product [Bursaphelenchus xylophilus]CAG9117730.1 unnamed protein product [Bursaphelenchus xylophilus]